MQVYAIIKSGVNRMKKLKNMNWRRIARDLLVTAAALTGAALLCVMLPYFY